MPQQTHLAGCATASSGTCTCEPRRYWYIFLITLGICAVQIIGGFFSGSLALFSDTIHVATDGLSALISFTVARQVLAHALSHKEEERKRRFWMRMSGILFILSLVWIGKEAIERYQDPSEVVGLIVVLAASIGMLGNVWQHRLVPHEHTMTSRMQRLHIEGDLYSSGAVIAAGIAIWVTDIYLIDPLLSFCLIFFIGFQTLQVMLSGEALHDHKH